MKLTNKKVKLIWKRHQKKIFFLVFMVTFLLVLNINIPKTMPMKNKPDEITIFQYGSSISYMQNDKSYNKLYEKFKNCSNSTLFHVLTGTSTMPSLQSGFEQELDNYLQYGLVLKVSYSRVQNLQHEGYDNLFSDLYFVLDYPPYGDQRSEAYNVIFYYNPEDGAIRSMGRISSTKNLAEYVKRLSSEST